jgi:carbon-monoxide dehydrogenase medium subunit
MWTHYYTVTSVAEALTLLANPDHQRRARLIAGGTDLLVELERGQRKSIDTLIDISRIPGLDQVTHYGDLLRIGALVTHNQLVADPEIVRHAYPLAQAAWEVGAPQIRNRATVAGNLITASPANDTITPLWALDATVTLSSLEGERTLTFPQFYQGVRRTAIRPDEMLTAIHIPALNDPADRGIFLKLGLRRAQAISVINVAVVISFEPDSQTIRQARITLGCVAPTILRVPTAENSLIGNPLSESVIREAARLASIAPSPIDDLRGTAEYRTEMVRVLVARALRLLSTHSERKTWAIQPPLLRTESPTVGLPTIDGDQATQPIHTTINGNPYTVNSGQGKTLLRFLREDCHLPGTKEGCAEGECGACTVFLDGAAVMACMTPAPRAEGAQITTVEGLADPVSGMLHPIQQAFIEAGAVQCGYCTPGFLMSAAKLLEEIPHPTREQAEQSITGNLCRCTGYYAILQAIQMAGDSDRAGE